MDSSAWAQRGIYGLFYKKGTSPKAPNPLIYINSMRLKNATDEELALFIKADLAGYIADTHNKVIELTPHAIKYGNPLRVFQLEIGDRQFELIAYYRQKDVVHMIVSVAVQKQILSENEKAFYAIIDSLVPMDME